MRWTARATATAPVPQASVSPSTPFSNVRATTWGRPGGAAVRHLGDARVGPFGRELRVVPHPPSVRLQVDACRVVDERDGVLGAGPDPDRGRLDAGHRCLREAARRRNVQADAPRGAPAVGDERGVAAAVGVEGQRDATGRVRAGRVGAEAGASGEASKAARAVAAHRRQRAVGVAVPHPEVDLARGVRVVEREEAVGADAGPPRADPGRERCQLVVREPQEAVVEDDEVVAGAAHLGERDDERKHGQWAVGSGQWAVGKMRPFAAHRSPPTDPPLPVFPGGGASRRR